MVRRCAHLAPAHLAEHAERIAGLIGGTSSAQTELPKKKALANARAFLGVW